MRIVEVIPKEKFTLYIKTDDGRSGLFDVAPYLDGEAFIRLKDRHEFEQIHNGGYFIEWNCGADLSVDTILARMQSGIESAPRFN